MSGKNTIPSERFTELRQLYERGDRLTDISAMFGVTARELREVLSNLNLPARTIKREVRQRAALPPAEISNLLAAYLDPDLPVQDILRRFDIPLSRLYAELQKAGHPRRKSMPAKVSSLSSKTRSNIVRSYVERRASVREIAASQAVSYDQVYVVLRESGVSLRSERKEADRNNEFLRRRFRGLYENDSVSLADILAQLHLTQHDLKVLLKELKLPPRGKGGGKRAIARSIIDMMPEYARRHEAGESVAKLAAEAGIGLATMKVRLKKLRS